MVHVPLMFLSEWREFLSAPCLAGGEKNLMTARVSMLLKSRASPDKLPFSLCNKKRLAIRYMNRPLFPTTLSIPSYDIGKQVVLRTYQHPFVEVYIMKQDRTFHIEMRECIDGLFVQITVKCPPSIKQSHCIHMGKKPYFMGLKLLRNKLKLILKLLMDIIPLKCQKGSCGCVILQRLRNQSCLCLFHACRMSNVGENKNSVWRW